jgi:hypothetical protein
MRWRSLVARLARGLRAWRLPRRPSCSACGRRGDGHGLSRHAQALWAPTVDAFLARTGLFAKTPDRAPIRESPTR